MSIVALAIGAPLTIGAGVYLDSHEVQAPGEEVATVNLGERTAYIHESEGPAIITGGAGLILTTLGAAGLIGQQRRR
jgi:ABC-type phosphate transport system permease subunit